MLEVIGISSDSNFNINLVERKNNISRKGILYNDIS